MTPAASEAGPIFAYAIEPLPPGVLGRRWRWELWEDGGGGLLAAGWHVSEARARRAVRIAAARRMYERLGLGAAPAAVVRAADSPRVRALLRPRPVPAPAAS